MKSLKFPLSEPLNPTLTLLVQAGEKVQNQKSKSAIIEALVDTGFDDYLTIPSSLAEELNLKISGVTLVELANGQQYEVMVATGLIKIIGYEDIQFDINILLGDDEEALIGTRLLSAICNKFSIDFQNSNLILENLIN